MTQKPPSEPTPARTESRPAPSGAAAGPDAAAWRRVRAGLLVEDGQVPAAVVQRWKAAARDPEFDADGCADEVLALVREESVDARVEARSTALLRELLIASAARGRSARIRRRTRSGIARLVYQVYMLVVWSGLALVAALLLRMRGVGFDAMLDRLLGVFH